MKATTLSPSAASRSSDHAGIASVQSSLQLVMQSTKQSRVHEDVLRAAGVRLDRAGVALLYKLRLAGDVPCRVSSLAQQLGVDAPAVTRKVQQLERLGYVSRDADPDDGRATLLRLTPSGHDTLERVLRAHRDRLAQLFEDWNEDEFDAFSTMLARFAQSLQAETEAANGE